MPRPTPPAWCPAPAFLLLSPLYYHPGVVAANAVSLPALEVPPCRLSDITVMPGSSDFPRLGIQYRAEHQVLSLRRSHAGLHPRLQRGGV